MTDNRDEEIQALLARLAALAGDPSDVELRTSLAGWAELRKERGGPTALQLLSRLVSRIDDDARRDEWATKLADRAGWDIRSTRNCVNSFR